MKAVLIGLALAVAAPAFAHADDLRDLCANRPGKGSPACILDTGHLQVEGDLFDQARDRRAGVTTTDTSIADFQIRYGLTKRSELQVSWAPFLTERVTGAGKATGPGDATLAVRWALTDPDSKGVAVALQPFVVAPVGGQAFTADHWSEGLVVPIAAPINDHLGLGLSPQVTRAPNASGHGDHTVWSGAAGISEALGPVTLGEELWAAQDQDPAGHTRQASFDLNAAWQPMGLKDVQVDAGFNAGLNHQTAKSEFYLGVAKRF